jgi:hypothetical protein
MTTARLNSVAAFSKWTLACPVFLVGRNASAQGKVRWTWPLSELMGKRVSMLARAL